MISWKVIRVSVSLVRRHWG